jgi:hypothetical protein
MTRGYFSWGLCSAGDAGMSEESRLELGTFAACGRGVTLGASVEVGAVNRWGFGGGGFALSTGGALGSGLALDSGLALGIGARRTAAALRARTTSGAASP